MGNVFEEFPTISESDNIPEDYSPHSDQQDAIITDLDIRSTRRQTNFDPADTEPLVREVADAGLRSTRRQTNTETDNTEQNSREFNDEDRQSTRRQQTSDSENVEMDSPDLPNDKDSDLSNYRGE